MSVTQPRESGALPGLPHVTADSLLKMKQSGQPITALTAYDFPTARLVDEAGIDLVLVGDSLGMVVLGYESTLPVTMEEMISATRAVRRGVRRALLVTDMPYGSYQVSDEEGVRNALRLVREAGAEAVKVEGGIRRSELVRKLSEAEISVVGHIGLTPQSLHRMSGYRVQGKTNEAIEALRADALALQEAGAIAIVLEGIPREAAAEITSKLTIPTIGIGAGPDCDGQILVFHDLVNLTFAPPTRFSRRYADGARVFAGALERYRQDVVGRTFPSDAESYHLPRAVKEERDVRVEVEELEALSKA